MKTIFKPEPCKKCLSTMPMDSDRCKECTLKFKNTPYTYNGYPLSSSKNTEGHYEAILHGIYALLNYMTTKFKNVFVVNMVVKYPLHSKHEYDLSTLTRAERCGENNKLFLDLLEYFSDYCRVKDYHPKYIWARERSLKTGGIHFHVLYCFDSNYIQNSYGLLSKAKELWGNCLNVKDPNGLVELWVPKPRNSNRSDGDRSFSNAEYLSNTDRNDRHQHDLFDIEELYRYGGIKLRRSDPEFHDKFALVFKYASYLAKVFSKGYSPYNVNEFGISKLD